MNRAERLTNILEFLKSGMSFSIDGIANKYRVSNRTVFRDIKTLKKLGYEVDFDNGYRLADSIQTLAFSGLSDLQLELIAFGLKTHPLRYILPLSELSAKISDSICDHSRNSFFKTPDQKTINFGQSFSAKNRKDEVKLSSFINAVEQNKSVFFKTKSGKFNGKFRPVGILFESRSIQLLVREDIHSVQVKVPLNDIQSIKIIAKSFSKAANST